jgi:hypothetical protein
MNEKEPDSLLQEPGQSQEGWFSQKRRAYRRVRRTGDS